MSADGTGELRAVAQRRARLAAQRRRRRLALEVGAALTAIVAVVAVVLLPRGPDRPPAATTPAATCGEPVLRVVAAEDVTPVLGRIAERYRAARGGDGCELVTVTAAASADIARSLADGAPGDAHAWVPESSVWTRLVEASPAGADLMGTDRPSIARSPTVVAMPRPMGEQLGWPGTQLGWGELLPLVQDPQTWPRLARPEWGPFRLGLPDPTRSAAGLHAVLSIGAGQSGVWTDALSADGLRNEAVRATLLTLERGTAPRRAPVAEQLAALRAADEAGEPLGPLAALPMSERDVWRYNAGLGGDPPAVGLVAFYPPEGGLSFDHPWVPLERAAADGVTEQAAAFRTFLLEPAAQDELRAAGYRGADDVPGAALAGDPGLSPARAGADAAPPDRQAVAAVLKGWAALSRRFTTLAVFDVSGSMAGQVPGTDRSLLAFVVESATRGAALFADDSHLGLWEFSTDLPGAQGGDYRELVPIGPVGEDLGGGRTRRAALVEALRGLRPANDTALYDTILAAYITARDASVPGRPTAIALFTDGESDGDDLSLPQLLDALRAEQDPSRPVRIALIAYGEAPPTAELTQVTDLVGGRVFTPSSPEGITQVFLDVLTSP